MPDRRANAPTTVVNWFTIGHHPARATQELARTAQFLRCQPGFDYLLRAQLATRPNVYVQLGYWRSHAAFVAAVRQPAFATLMERLAGLDITTRADQATSLTRVGLPPAYHDPSDAVGFLIEYFAVAEHAAVERALRTQVESYLTWPGFGGADVLRSIVRPSRYLSVSWWFDADQRQAAMRSAVAVPATTILATTDPALTVPATTVRAERTRQLRCERPAAPG